ncbi:MAG: hypothetical protein CMJ75_02045 [Planctomycetaceae bacterium]|nr:hypothetical protein [Planctomycetaceae bacterium]
MRFRHFESLRPVCPKCRQGALAKMWPLQVASRAKEHTGVLVEGRLTCTNPQCLGEFPVIDGIPIIVPDVAAYIATHQGVITRRTDLAHETMSLIGDCCGPGSEYDTERQQLSTYVESHFGDCVTAAGADTRSQEGSFLQLLEGGFQLCGALPTGPILDVGCGVGRSAWYLAEQCDTDVLGVDLNFAFLRVAQEILQRGHVSIGRRKIGVVYEAREFAVDLPAADKVDFWCCDALALPFSSQHFSLSNCLNVLDCVCSPIDLLRELERVLVTRGWLLASSPYDWSPGTTAPGAWIGGHSDRGELQGAAEPLLRQLLAAGGHPQSLDALRLRAESAAIDWAIWLHERSCVQYKVHAFAAQKEDKGSG